MRVIPVAATQLTGFEQYNVETATQYQCHPITDDDFVACPDELAEFAGRNCYQSWSRPNPKTATNEGYLANILDQGHFSVLEHASITFYVDGVSRSLLTELERHRFLSFSVVSQRYVRMTKDQHTVPPAIEENGRLVINDGGIFGNDWTVRDEFDASIESAFESYDLIADKLIEEGLPRKKAFEAARSVLPGAVDSPMVVTGNIRAWRDVISRRYHEAADAEIREFATEVLKHLRIYAPNSVQDIPEEPYK